MCSDDNINLAGFELSEDLLDLFGTARTREIIDAHRKLLQTLLECIVMLISENCSGDEHGYLLAVHGCLEGCAYRHLGLAETDVAADQTVHGTFALHIGFHCLCGGELIGRIFVDK